jgi:hypothetical protein
MKQIEHSRIGHIRKRWHLAILHVASEKLILPNPGRYENTHLIFHLPSFGLLLGPWTDALPLDGH